MQIREFQVRTPDARQLDLVDTDDIAQPAIVVHHGTPGARRLYSGWTEDAESWGVRLIGYSRPGYGASSRMPGRQVVDAAPDLAAIAEHPQISKLATWGYSGGAALTRSAVRLDCPTWWSRRRL